MSPKYRGRTSVVHLEEVCLYDVINDITVIEELSSSFSPHISATHVWGYLSN